MRTEKKERMEEDARVCVYASDFTLGTYESEHMCIFCAHKL